MLTGLVNSGSETDLKAADSMPPLQRGEINRGIPSANGD